MIFSGANLMNPMVMRIQEMELSMGPQASWMDGLDVMVTFLVKMDDN